MGKLYDNINALCEEKGIKPSKLCSDVGISRGLITDLKMGRKNGITAVTAQKIASYFGVSVGYLLGEETEKAPADNGKRSVSDAELKFALWGDCEDVSDDDLADVLRYAAFVRERKKDKK